MFHDTVATGTTLFTSTTGQDELTVFSAVTSPREELLPLLFVPGQCQLCLGSPSRLVLVGSVDHLRALLVLIGVVKETQTLKQRHSVPLTSHGVRHGVSVCGGVGEEAASIDRGGEVGDAGAVDLVVFVAQGAELLFVEFGLVSEGQCAYQFGGNSESCRLESHSFGFSLNKRGRNQIGTEEESGGWGDR